MKLLGRGATAHELHGLLREASLRELMDLVGAVHDVHFHAVRVGGETLDCLQITDMPAYIDRQVEQLETNQGIDALPLWARIWPASLPLAMYMQRQTPQKDDKVLELGAGLGIAGLFAARRGFRVVISDNNPDALLFARINVLQNNLAHHAEVALVDFVAGGHQGIYSHIIASEILYRENLFAPLLQFLRDHVPSNTPCKILLSADKARHILKFFVAAKEHFRIARSMVPVLSCGDLQEDPGHNIYIYRMKTL
jgi:predicted nicotinamide N-methyase